MWEYNQGKGFFQQPKNILVKTVLKTQISNDPNRCRYMLLDNIYVSPQLLSIINYGWLIRYVGTCSGNWIGFGSEALKLDNQI